jgi:cyclophilin family peptidyl-prolyl cis-trans isomerase
MSKSSDIADLFDHLELNDAFLAAQYPADIEDFCKVYPEKVIGLALVGPNETNSSAFEIIAERILMINSEHGPTKTAANDFKKDLKKASTYEIKNYEILPWSDISIDHPKQLFKSLSKFFGSIASKKKCICKIQNGRKIQRHLLFN